MSCCAVCCSDRGPFTMQRLGKDDALVSVCRACDAPVFVKDSASQPGTRVPYLRRVMRPRGKR